MSNSAVASISKIQRQACIAITGALKTTSSESLNTIVGLIPLEDFITQYAASAALRLQCLGLWITKGYGHSIILQRFPLTFNQKYDYISPIYNFDRSYSVNVPPRDYWQNRGQPSRHEVDIFTDGSKSTIVCGAGVHVMSYNISLANKLPSDCSIIQCEIYAIIRACEFVENIDFVGKRINICTDS